jgi:hypothetical protein
MCCCKHHVEGHIEFAPKNPNKDPEIVNMENILGGLSLRNGSRSTQNTGF